MKAALCVAVVLCVALVAAKECRAGAARQVWKHSKGSFKHVPGTNDWQEVNEDGSLGSLFRQVLTEGTSIVIRNDDRKIELLLRDDLAGIKNEGEQQFQQLYGGGWLSIVDCT